MKVIKEEPVEILSDTHKQETIQMLPGKIFVEVSFNKESGQGNSQSAKKKLNAF